LSKKEYLQAVNAEAKVEKGEDVSQRRRNAAKDKGQDEEVSEKHKVYKDKSKGKRLQNISSSCPSSPLSSSMASTPPFGASSLSTLGNLGYFSSNKGRSISFTGTLWRNAVTVLNK
jgi:hypothetical protein